MTEAEWKAFDKSPGATVWIPDSSGSLKPWKIENVWPNGTATVYQEGEFHMKTRQCCHYVMFRTKAQKEEQEKAMTEKRTEEGEERRCIICGATFTAKYPQTKTCSTKCSKEHKKLLARQWHKTKRAKQEKENKND